MRNEILDLIGTQYGCAAGTGIYRKIDLWQSWWQGKERTFHEYWENGSTGQPIRREMYRLHMAKKVCEDWASLLFNDKTYLHVQDGAAEEWLTALFDRTDFWRRCNHLVEKTFALGSGACILRIHGLPDVCDTLADAGPALSVSFDFVDAGHILPISVEAGQITEAAFISEIRFRGEKLLYVEIHTREEDGYVIRNRYFKDSAGSVLQEIHPAGMPSKEIRTGCPYPFFSILTPNLHNAVDEGCGLGQSIYADALDCLKGVDLAFNNFCRDLKLGGKKVFINQSLVNRDESGTLYTPDDVAQQLFVTIGDGDIAEHPMITEHNPSLRSEENRDALQAQLDYLSFRCGLGTRQYLFSGVQGKAQLTATQYTGERQDMRQNLSKHQQNMTMFLKNLLRPLLWVGEYVLRLPIDSLTSVQIRYDDSYFTDTESERNRDLREVKAGLMTSEEFRRKWYCEIG